MRLFNYTLERPEFTLRHVTPTKSSGTKYPTVILFCRRTQTNLYIMLIFDSMLAQQTRFEQIPFGKYDSPPPPNFKASDSPPQQIT